MPLPRKPRKGDRLRYTGKYAHEMPEAFGSMTPADPVPPYPPGTVVGFRSSRFSGPTITVLLDKSEGDTQDLYADWPINEVEFA
jgi:hypothetical protein